MNNFESANHLAAHRASRLLSYGPEIPEQYALWENAEPLRFVVKRHRATSLHTDFRLEACGQLLSWVLWKHPILNPGKIVAAREMPDHDPRYINGERRIPDGSYGAGPMVVWDYGTYRPLSLLGTSAERTVVLALQQGYMDFWLDGVRLKGGFRLQMETKDWSLIKLDDKHATTSAVEWDDHSIITGKSLDQLEAEYQRGM